MITPPSTDFRTLYFFLRVLDTQSFSEVARQENVATSVVSRAIRQLEDQLQQQFFYRNTRAVTPTEAGLLFAEDVRVMMEQFNQAQRKLHERKQEPSGIVRLNAPVVFGRRHIAPHLPALAEKYPQLDVNLMLTDDYIEPHIEPTDIIFRISSLTNSSMHAKIIAKQRHYIVASPAYLAKYGIPKKPVCLEQHRCIIYRNNLGINRWLIKENGQWVQQNVPAVLTTNNGETIYTACKQGLGLAMLPDWSVYEGLRSGELVKVLEHYQTAIHTEQRTIAMLYPDMRHNSLNVRAVLDFFSELFGENGYWAC
ncbi:LysR family transcriptional regulator [Actinobacillus succinogenes]|uniref:Transcriptional regulator, LysR family n=1 Tax=Actinobacillus succinogenes (strain ATCC 55618 / DSM 22257 / CCUG 43843 / 130Z) TaxID=339671 RepID=A6VPK2_ACTSZ|nr:LysR family transcriptional regulator [Actinobacillus succinogenes]ABR74899.1 transcriptional regulator, LysR family [Actinobacillus succinogenes 130Z]PHI40689.1 LysR family transcriptional regulator [Actinobacillus succinogenes]